MVMEWWALRPAVCAGRWVVLGTLAFLNACGGGGGGGGGTDGGSPQPSVPSLSADVYPLATGDRRTWQVTQGAASGSLRHERVGEAVGNALVVRSGGPDLSQTTDDEYRQRTAAGVSAVAGPNSDPLTRAAGSVELLRFGIPQGQTVTLMDRILSVDVDGDGRADSVEIRIDSVFTGVEAVTTSLAAYADASRVRTTARTTVRLAGATAVHTVTQTLDDWYVPGIGPVRSTSSTSTDGGVPDVQAEEVVAYGVGSRHSEAIAPAVTASLPADASVGGTSTEIRLTFSEAVDPLSLLGDAGLQLLLDGRVVQPRGLRLSQDAKTLTVLPPTDRLADGTYELRHGSQMSDWAGNLLPVRLTSFRVDTTGPRLTASMPAEGAVDVPLAGDLVLEFDEALVLPPGGGLLVSLQGVGGFVEPLPVKVSVQGKRVVLSYSGAKPNTAYVAIVNGGANDAVGNPMSPASLQFRTDTGAFGRPQAWASGMTLGALAVADVNGDGRADLVFTAQKQGSDFIVGTRLQQPDGRYAEPAVLFTFTGQSFCDLNHLAVGDLDGDERADIVVRGQCSQQPLNLLRQGGDGSFSLEPVPIDLNGPLSVLDGGLAGSTTAGLTLWRRQGVGKWQATSLAPLGTFDVRDWQSVDLNGDGRPDLVWVQGTEAGFVLGWRLRAGDGWGPIQTRSLPASTPRALGVGDVDGDSRPDVLLAVDTGVSGPASNGELWVLTQTPSGGMREPLRLASGWGASALLVADVNGDGRLDAVVAHDTLWRTGVYLQSASGVLEPERLFESAYGYFSSRRPLAWLDLNGDGYKDIVQMGVLLPGRAFSGPWPEGLAAQTALRAATNRLLRGVAATASPGPR